MTKALTIGLLLLASLLAAAAPPPATPAPDLARRGAPGDRVETFALPDLEGAQRVYDPAGGRVTAVAFLAAHHKRSERTVLDVEAAVARLRAADEPVDLLVIVSDEDAPPFRRRRAELVPGAEVLVDAGSLLWRRLGVIVVPTTFVIDDEGTILWRRAGHAYDFARELDGHLERALGLEEAPGVPDGSPAPAPPTAVTDDDRMWHHVRLAQILARRGRLEAAVAEIEKAEAMAPDAVPAVLESARLRCRAGRPREALAALERIRPESPQDRAQVASCAGWAHRLLGDLDRAAARLDEAIELDPDLAAAHFERGRVYEARQRCDEAVAAYRRALELTYGGE